MKDSIRLVWKHPNGDQTNKTSTPEHDSQSQPLLRRS